MRRDIEGFGIEYMQKKAKRERQLSCISLIWAIFWGFLPLGVVYYFGIEVVSWGVALLIIINIVFQVWLHEERIKR